MVEIHKEVKTFERKIGEQIENYIAQFNALETKLRNEEIKLPDTFLVAMLMGD